MNDKLSMIAQYPMALQTLRVCYKNSNNQYNCGRCNKCVLTMIGLFFAGALEKCTTLPHDVGIELVRVIARSGFLEELLEALRNSKLDRGCRESFEKTIETAIVQRERNATENNAWLRERLKRVDEVVQVVQGRTAILVDEDQIRHQLPSSLRVFPFLERDGGYWGAPINDQNAIEELERLREMGAELIVITEPASWWLEYYSGFHQFLRSRFPCVSAQPHLTVFELSRLKTLIEETDGTSEPVGERAVRNEGGQVDDHAHPKKSNN